jgi:hypothetical protein
MSILKDRRDLIECFIEKVVGDEPHQINSRAGDGTGAPLDTDVGEVLLVDLETKLLEIL